MALNKYYLKKSGTVSFRVETRMKGGYLTKSPRFEIVYQLTESNLAMSQAEFDHQPSFTMSEDGKYGAFIFPALQCRVK